MDFQPLRNLTPAERYPGQLHDEVALRPVKPKLIYISGPLTTGQLTANVRRALDVGKVLIDRGYAVIVPHEKLLTEILHPMSYEDWLAYDFRIILCCDGVLRIDGDSHGGDREVAFAVKNRIPVFYSLDTLYAHQWAPIQ
jgi:hypothetical protein